MNYIFYLKKQIILYIITVLVFIICGAVTRYFKYGEIIDLIDLMNLISNHYHLTLFISYSLTFIFLVPFYSIWFNSLKK